MGTLGTLIAVSGLTLTALSLTGSTQTPANPPLLSNSPRAAVVKALGHEGYLAYSAGRYLDARKTFLTTADAARRAGLKSAEALAWSNAGGAALVRQDYRDALSDFLEAKQAALRARQFNTLAVTMNNLASLYLQMGRPADAMRVAREGLDGPAGTAGPAVRPKLRAQLATALARLGRFDEARPIFHEAIDELDEQGDREATARALASLGSAAMDANQVEDASAAYTEALRLVRIHRLEAQANVLRGLARVKASQGDRRSAASLFDAAIAAPQAITPRWVIFADRGEFHLAGGNLRGALADFRQARTLAGQMRADIVPADQDRIALESGLGRVAQGLVEAGNRLARETGDKTLLEETFNAAEQDRLWSLQAIIPTANDWRTRLPAEYWDTLSRYQSVERSRLAKPSTALEAQAANLTLELERLETRAGNGAAPQTLAQGSTVGQLKQVRDILDGDTVLFSFHIAKSNGWLWAVNRSGVAAFRVPGLDELKPEIVAFTAAVQADAQQAIAERGLRLYGMLFGGVPPPYLSRGRWLLELDGPLFDLPFAALVTEARDTQSGDRAGSRPAFLIERASLQTIPSALLLQPAPPSGKGYGDGAFLGVGDPVYNTLDERYRGSRKPGEVVLPRLGGTSAELDQCARAWGGRNSRLLTGANASLEQLDVALQANPSVIHFATHVVTAPGDYSSGLIALSLDSSGAMGLLGPARIVAHRVTAGLVVMNGCHSGQGAALPSAGLMGLTRSWLAAGAGAVLATGWDIPDAQGTEFMTDYYRALKAGGRRGPAFALREAQLASIAGGGPRATPAFWGAYFLIARVF